MGCSVAGERGLREAEVASLPFFSPFLIEPELKDPRASSDRDERKCMELETAQMGQPPHPTQDLWALRDQLSMAGQSYRKSAFAFPSNTALTDAPFI